MPKNTDLTKPETTALGVPDYIPKGDFGGTEHIGRDDIQMPRLALAQSLSPELDESNARYIEGLKLGHMFNSLTGENYKTGPVEFHVLRADRPRWVEFNPREQGGGVKDPNVPHGDPRTEFTKDPTTGMSVPPIATKFYDYIVLLLPWNADDPISNYIALSFKSTGLKIARQFNTLLQLRRKRPMYAAKFSITSVDEQNAKGKYKNFKIKNTGWAEESQLAALGEMFDELKDQDITVHRDELPEDAGGELPGGAVGDPSFDPSEM